MKIVRALWGNYEAFVSEIPTTPLFNEIVYVWGTDNKTFLDNLGYDTKLVSTNSDVYFNLDNTETFKHKLDCFKLASDDFGEFLFLDWDVSILKDIDNNFYSTFKGKDFCCPLYAYPNSFLDLLDTNTEWEIAVWQIEQIKQLKLYNWSWLIVLPNAGFFYCSNPSIPDKLIQITKENKLTTLVEEFSIFILSNCELTEYINKYEPTQIFGRPDGSWHFKVAGVNKDSSYRLNNYIRTLVDKDIYLKHYE